MSTATLSQKLKGKKAEKPVVKDITDTQHQEVIELIRGRTMEMSFTVHGLPKSRKITGKTADKIAAAVKGTRRGVKASWTMFTSEHPAVKELNAAIRDLDAVREAWTIVKSADVKKGDGDKVSIAGGKRLIWDKDVPEFYALFVKRAKLIDMAAEKLQHAMDNVTYDADDNPIKSVKDMDRENAEEAWDESAYPKDVRQVVGVAKERGPDGMPRIGNDGDPVYIISFSEYHVSEKLPALLRERAIQRIDAGLSGTIETAMTYAVNELSESMLTFMDELSNRMKVYPVGEYKYLTEHGEAEVVKRVTHADDDKVPPGQVKVYIRYVEKDVEGEKKVAKWLGPMKEAEFGVKLRPQTTGERKKIYPSVIEGIINQLQTFKEKKAKMLGVYGENLTEAFAPLLATLTKAKEGNPWAKNEDAAKKLAAVLKTDEEVRTVVSKAVADTVEALEEQVKTVKETTKRRSVKMSLVGKLDEE